MARRQYTDDEKAACIAVYEAEGRNLKRAARRCKLAPMTLWHWVRGDVGTNGKVPTLVPEKKAELADLLETVARDALALAPESAELAAFGELMTGVGIAIDKMRLLREQSTSITESRELSREERVNRLADELARLGIGVPGEISRTPEPAES